MNIIPEKALYTGPPEKERAQQLWNNHFVDHTGRYGFGWGRIFRRNMGNWEPLYPPAHPLSGESK